jgi:hypothetical protein
VVLQNKYDEKKFNFLVLLQNKQNRAIFAPYAKTKGHAKPHNAEGKKRKYRWIVRQSLLEGV